MRYIYDLSPEEIHEWTRQNSFPKYRGDQIINWVSKGISSTGEMNNIPKSIRESLDRDFSFDDMVIIDIQRSKTDGTVKYVYQLKDGNIIESVLMKYSYGHSVCVSSQAGCKMSCTFCASTGAGFGRNLSSGEMVFQVLSISKDLGQRISHTVVMGIGEPLENYDNLIKFIHQINNPDIHGIGMRKISVSTCGLIAEMIKFIDEGLPITLCVSLHAPSDEIRKKIMPIARSNSMDELLKACRLYVEKTRRRITFEYILMKDVNDRVADARLLASKLKGIMCHINLIPANEYKGCNFKTSSSENIKAFCDILSGEGLNYTVRRQLGRDIDAACGNLRRQKLLDND